MTNLPDSASTTFNGSTNLLALFGGDLVYSKSPELHNRWIKETGMNACYLPLEIKENANFLPCIEGLARSHSFLGANITNPFKTLVTSSAMFAPDSRVQAIGAANTLYRKEDTWILTNTDVDGVLATLTSGIPEFQNTNWQVIILGGGGAAAAAAYGLTQEVSHCQVSCVLRNPTRAHPFLMRAGVRILSERGDQVLDPSLSQDGHGRILINSTPLGQKLEPHPMAEQLISQWLVPYGKSVFFFDMTYGNNPSVLLAQRLQVPHANGMTMLMTQAQRSFALWHNVWKDSQVPD